MQHLDSLNERQREAAQHINGPLLILAGAGAGKTKTLTHRILHLIESGVAPARILAVTFTNKAAREMRERVQKLVAEDPAVNRPVRIDSMPLVTTFHSFSAQLLRENARLLGLPRHFTIYDRSDSVRAIKDAQKKVGLDPKEFDPRHMLGTISRTKGDCLARRAFEDGADTYYKQLVAEVWGEYERILERERALDFDDLLLSTVEMLRNHPIVKQHCHERWRYISVDEYQDTNVVQYELTRLLAEKHRNVCVVADVDQMIYAWRGANVDTVLNFEHDYSDARMVMLEENYRSTQTIIAASNTVIAKNRKRREKTLFTRNGVGESITLYPAYDEADEAQFAVARTKQLVRGGRVPLNEIAVLYRANFQSRALEEAFLEAEVPYQVLGTKFFERKEVKDALSFLRLALNPESLADLKRVINVPPRGIGKVTLLKIIEGRESGLSGAAAQRIEAFRRLMERIQKAARTQPPSETIRFILAESGLEAQFAHGSSDEQERLENVRELVTLAKRFDGATPEEGCERLLESAALASDQDTLEEHGGVKLMTVHAAKGLEFDYVFVTGLEEGLFPHEPLDAERVDDEEERRLFYVALTRARKKVFLTYTSLRTIFGRQRVNIPSEFISDIDEALIEMAEPEVGDRLPIIE